MREWQVAAYNGNFEIVRVLLSHKADVEQRNRAQETPLHLACRQGQARVVRSLLENGADSRYLQWTPIEKARSRLFLEILPNEMRQS